MRLLDTNYLLLSVYLPQLKSIGHAPINKEKFLIQTTNLYLCNLPSVTWLQPYKKTTFWLRLITSIDWTLNIKNNSYLCAYQLYWFVSILQVLRSTTKTRPTVPGQQPGNGTRAQCQTSSLAETLASASSLSDENGRHAGSVCFWPHMTKIPRQLEIKEW